MINFKELSDLLKNGNSAHYWKQPLDCVLFQPVSLYFSDAIYQFPALWVLCLWEATVHYHRMTCSNPRKWPRMILYACASKTKLLIIPSQYGRPLLIFKTVFSNQIINTGGKVDVEKTHQGAMKIGCISLRRWGGTCRQAPCSVECDLRRPHPCDSQRCVSGLGCG